MEDTASLCAGVVTRLLELVEFFSFSWDRQPM